MFGIQIRKNWKRSFNTDDFFWYQIIYMQMAGHWPIDYTKVLPDSMAFLSRYINLFYMTFITFANWHMAVLFTVSFLMDAFSDEEVSVTKSSDEIMSIVLHCYSGFGGFYIQANQKKCLAIMKKINERFHRRSARGITYVTTEPSYSYANEAVGLWNFLLLGCVTVLVPVNLYTKSGQELIIPVWYPYNEYEPIKFVFTYIMQVWVQWALLFGFGNIGCFLMVSVILICGQYDILFCSLKNLRYTAMLRAGGNIDKLKSIQSKYDESVEEINQYYFNHEQLEDLDHVPPFTDIDEEVTTKKSDTYLMDFHRELHQCLKDCIFHHQMILDCCADLEEFMSPLIFIKSLQISSQICNLTYVSTKTTASFFINFTKIYYLCLTLCELFIFGYVGNWMKVQSYRVSDAIFRSPWHLCGGPFRRAMIMMMTNNMKPAVLTGGRFFVLDYDKMKAIITASFSYFTLLEKLGK